MQVTRALEYANRSMVFLAAQKEPVIVSEIAKSTAAPPNFLHQVLNNLARAGLVVCHRGTTRGYVLAKPAGDISLLDIFEVIEGPLGLTACTMESNWCVRQGTCTLSGVWHDVQNTIAQKLGRATLDKLAPSRIHANGCPTRVD